MPWQLDKKPDGHGAIDHDRTPSVPDPQVGLAYGPDVERYFLDPSAPDPQLPDYFVARRWPKPGERVVFGMLGGPFILPAALKDEIERLEPGVHAFIPVEFRSRGKKRETYFLLKAPPVVDCVVIEESDFGTPPHVGRGRDFFEERLAKNKARSVPLPFVETGRYPEHRIVLDPEAIAGRHLWRPQEGVEPRLMISDQLAAWIKTNRIRGVETRVQYVLQQPDGELT